VRFCTVTVLWRSSCHPFNTTVVRQFVEPGDERRGIGRIVNKIEVVFGRRPRGGLSALVIELMVMSEGRVTVSVGMASPTVKLPYDGNRPPIMYLFIIAIGIEPHTVTSDVLAHAIGRICGVTGRAGQADLVVGRTISCWRSRKPNPEACLTRDAISSAAADSRRLRSVATVIDEVDNRKHRKIVQTTSTSISVKGLSTTHTRRTEKNLKAE